MPYSIGHQRLFGTAAIVCGGLFIAGLTANARQQERQFPPVPPPPNAKGLVVLFDGTKESLEKNWVKHNSNEPPAWKMVDEGGMVVSGGDIVTKEKFTDYQLHVEFKVPFMPGKRGQARGNSGVFQQGRYEIQVLDSYGVPAPGTGEVGAVYSRSAPLQNASRPPKMWQTYDIVFRAPRYDEKGQRWEQAQVTVLLNGICVQNNTEIFKPTWGETFGKLSDPGPIVLQDHGNPMEYRNIWIMPLPAKGPDYYEGPTTIKD
jgi:hypothetical protein